MNEYQPLVLGSLGTNCWIIPLEEKAAPLRPCAVIDPAEQANLIIHRLQQLRYYPAYILLTHGHFDHIAALPDLLDGPWPAEPIVAIHRDDAAYLGKEAERTHKRDLQAIGLPFYMEETWSEMPSPTLILKEGDLVGPLKVIHLPGHTPGSVGFFHEEDRALFAGDTLFRRGVGRTDLPGGDFPTLEQSLERLFRMDGNIRVYPGHGPATTIGAEVY